MSIAHEILGPRYGDNALMVTVDSGRARSQWLFDCGEGVLDGIGKGRRQAIDGLFFSHLHMDHVAGFDGFFRHVFRRRSKPNRIWGPAGTAAAMQHRFRGFLWNWSGSRSAIWTVEEIAAEGIATAQFDFAEAFALRRDTGRRAFDGRVLSTRDMTVDALILDHGTDSIGYILRETPSLNVDTGRLAALGLEPGPWLTALREGAERAVVAGEARDLAPLREELLVERAGDSIAYLTDFYLDEAGIERLAPALAGVGTLVCEAQYRNADRDLAERNGHMTAGLTGRLAREAGVGALTLVHLSERYEPPEQAALLDEARAEFEPTGVPGHWRTGRGQGSRAAPGHPVE